MGRKDREKLMSAIAALTAEVVALRRSNEALAEKVAYLTDEMGDRLPEMSEEDKRAERDFLAGINAIMQFGVTGRAEE